MEARHDRFRRLLAPVHDRVLAFARSLSRSRLEGDDLYQDAVVRALAKLDDLRADAAFRTWFFRIVVTVHRNRVRRAFWSRLLPFADGKQPDVDVPDEIDYRAGEWTPDAAEAATRARDALATLPAVQREAIVLFEIEGWQVDEIAELQRVSTSAVKSRLARGRERLRVFYTRQFSTSAVPTAIPGEST